MNEQDLLALIDHDLLKMRQRSLHQGCKLSVVAGQPFRFSRVGVLLSVGVSVLRDGGFRYIGMIRDEDGYPIKQIQFEICAGAKSIRGVTNALGCFAFDVPASYDSFNFGFLPEDSLGQVVRDNPWWNDTGMKKWAKHYAGALAAAGGNEDESGSEAIRIKFSLANQWTVALYLSQDSTLDQNDYVRLEVTNGKIPGPVFLSSGGLKFGLDSKGPTPTSLPGLLLKRQSLIELLNSNEPWLLIDEQGNEAIATIESCS